MLKSLVQVLDCNNEQYRFDFWRAIRRNNLSDVKTLLSGPHYTWDSASLHYAIRNSNLEICQFVVQQYLARQFNIDNEKCFYAALKSGNADIFWFIRKALSISADDIHSYRLDNMFEECILSKTDETFMLMQNEFDIGFKEKFATDKDMYLKMIATSGNFKLFTQVLTLYDLKLSREKINHLLWRTEYPQMIVYLMQLRGDHIPYATPFLQFGFDGLDEETVIDIYKGTVVNEFYLQAFPIITQNVLLTKRIFHPQDQLIEAILNNDLPRVEMLIKEFPRAINQLDAYGVTLLQIAILCRQTEIVAFLIKGGANVNVELPSGDNLLTLACKMHVDNSDIIAILADTNININHQDAEGNTALSIVTSLRSNDDYKKLRILLDKGADVTIANNTGLFPMDYVNKEIYYHQSKHLSEVAKLLFSQNFVRITTREEMIPAYQWLVTAVTIDTPLRARVYKLILPMIVVGRFFTVIPSLAPDVINMRYTMDYPCNITFNILEHAAYTNSEFIMHGIIIRKLECEDLVKVLFDLSNALFFAVAGEARECVELLLTFNINVSYVGSNGASVLSCAIEQNNLGMVMLLVAHNANVTHGEASICPLMKAIEFGRDNIVEFLLKQLTHVGARYLVYAIHKKQTRILNLLLEADTDINLPHQITSITALICNTPELYAVLPALMRFIIKQGSVDDLFTLLKKQADLVYQIEFNKLPALSIDKLIKFVDLLHWREENNEINFHYLSKKLMQMRHPGIYHGLLHLLDMHHSSDNIVNLFLSKTTLRYSFTAILNDLFNRYQHEPHTSKQFIYISLAICERLNELFRCIEAKEEQKFPALARTQQQRLQRIYADLAAEIMQRFPIEKIPAYLQGWHQNRIQFTLFTNHTPTSPPHEPINKPTHNAYGKT